MKKRNRILLSLVLVFTLLFASVQPLAVAAASPDEDDITSSVTYGDGVIEENVTVNFEDYHRIQSHDR